MASVDTRYRKFIAVVAKEDVDIVLKKDEEYGASWKRRGGVGAYMMAARKMDRLEEQCKKHGYDIFKACQDNTTSESIMDTLRDLRAYLLLIESEVRSQGVKGVPSGSVLTKADAIPMASDVRMINRCNQCGGFHIHADDCPNDPGPAHL